jgi:hypothetical protein
MTAASVPGIRQKARIILIPRIVRACAISPQQECRALDRIVSTQADAGTLYAYLPATRSNTT